MTSATKKANIRPVHPFPARMAPSIVWDTLTKSGDSLTVLDPMSGSGTTLVCARSKGHRAIGCDTDPLALLIAGSWCADTDPDQIKARANLVLERARKFHQNMDPNESYPKGADEETRRFIDFWFDPGSRCELTSLAACISRVRSNTEKGLLWCSFSRMIITKTKGVSLAMDVSHSRPHKVYDVAPVRPFDVFLKAASTVAGSCPFRLGFHAAPPADVRWGDARALPLKPGSVDIVITSPPYLNAIDYLRGHKLSLVWMGHTVSELRLLRASNIGTEVGVGPVSDRVIESAMSAMGDIEALGNRRLGMARRYAKDMSQVMGECARVLKKGGRAVFVVGDSSIRGVFVRNSGALEQIAKSIGLRLHSRMTRPIEAKRRYMPPPETVGGRMQGRMREEVILEFHAL